MDLFVKGLVPAFSIPSAIYTCYDFGSSIVFANHGERFFSSGLREVALIAYSLCGRVSFLAPYADIQNVPTRWACR